jgi:hypothetical protein
MACAGGATTSCIALNCRGGAIILVLLHSGLALVSHFRALFASREHPLCCAWGPSRACGGGVIGREGP